MHILNVHVNFFSVLMHMLKVNITALVVKKDMLMMDKKTKIRFPSMIRWRLKILMAERDMDNTQLMELTQLHRNTITKLKNNPPDRLTIDTLNRLCKALDCQPGDLLSYIPEQELKVEI